MMDAFDDFSQLLYAIARPDNGPDEVIMDNGRIRVERKDNQITVAGVGEIQSPLMYAKDSKS